MLIKANTVAASYALAITLGSVGIANAATVSSSTLNSNGAEAYLTDYGSFINQFELEIAGTINGGENPPYMAMGSDLSLFAIFDTTSGDLILGDVSVGAHPETLYAEAISSSYFISPTSLTIEFEFLDLVSGFTIGDTVTATITPSGLDPFTTLPTLAQLVGDYTVDVELSFDLASIPSAIPLPAGLPLLGLGLGLIGVSGYRRRS